MQSYWVSAVGSLMSYCSLQRLQRISTRTNEHTQLTASLDAGRSAQLVSGPRKPFHHNRRCLRDDIRLGRLRSSTNRLWWRLGAIWPSLCALRHMDRVGNWGRNFPQLSRCQHIAIRRPDQLPHLRFSCEASRSGRANG